MARTSQQTVWLVGIAAVISLAGLIGFVGGYQVGYVVGYGECLQTGPPPEDPLPPLLKQPGV